MPRAHYWWGTFLQEATSIYNTLILSQLTGDSTIIISQLEDLVMPALRDFMIFTQGFLSIIVFRNILFLALASILCPKI